MTALGPSVERRVTRLDGGGRHERPDVLTTEEPMEIEVDHFDGAHWREMSLAVTMRTPGSDFELAAGFLYTEGIVAAPADIAHMEHCPLHGAEQEFNVVKVRLGEALRLDEAKLHRHFYTTSSCGVCGKTSLEAVRRTFPSGPPPGVPRVSKAFLIELPAKLRQAQTVFSMTGGLHAAGIFTAAGDRVVVREDVGRHNALDKVIGERLLAGALPLSQAIVAVSGRASFELVQKALSAQVPILAAVGAASSLAVDLAREYGMTLVGFLRENGLTVYSGDERTEA